ncbi:uncharacterized protein LOC112043671 [Bicyclus anynana]|uniref:Uncharacterized protein LOC112043671 n=1 Tax=Bicyclus anynana TaxID=110368 RepID=A0ABM3LEV4_BICAN|nr:uncharacterized protein LOC112043671 [Bicyclus anynana]
MDTKHTPMRAKTMAELLPGIKHILSKETVMLLSSQKKPNAGVRQTQTGKNLKPMKIAEILALKGPTPRAVNHQPPQTKMKTWNSSVKVDKTKQLTKHNEQKYNTVRKTLNFQQKASIVPANNRATTVGPMARKSIYPQVKSKGNTINRISGVCKIPDTPLSIKPLPNRVVKMKNVSFKSNSDDSFLQKEKEINDFEAKSNALADEPTLERIDEISPPISTPFHDYRNVRDYFNQSEADNSVAWNNDTLMLFDKVSEIKDNTQREESVIVSLCELLNKATVTSNNDNNRNIVDADEIERQIVNDIKVIDNVIVILKGFKEEKLKFLQHNRKLKQQVTEPNICNDTILEKENIAPNITEKNESAAAIIKEITKVKEEITSPERNPIIKRPTVIKSRSPSYKIPKKSICLRQKVFHKSMPNISDMPVTPNRNTDKALSMYMQIKEKMSFLNTPLAKPRNDTPDTPALTSRNLQTQLDKLYNDI